MSNYNKDTFLGESFKNIKILDNNGILTYTIKPNSIFHISVLNNIVKIELKDSRTILLNFNDSVESAEALVRIQLLLDSKLNNIEDQIKNLESQLISLSPKYLVYTALLTQSSNSDPVATVLENTIGDIVWGYDSTGTYNATLLNAFPINKTFILMGNGFAAPGFRGFKMLTGNGNTIDSITIALYKTNDNSQVDGLLYNTPIEIRVYLDI